MRARLKYSDFLFPSIENKMHQKKGLFQEFTGPAELEVFERAILEPIEKEPCMVEELANEFHKRQDIKSYTEYQKCGKGRHRSFF